jgi:hypothetical protein
MTSVDLVREKKLNRQELKLHQHSDCIIEGITCKLNFIKD